MSNTVLAIDLGTNLGYYFDGTPHAAHFPKEDRETKYWKWITSLLSQNKQINTVVIENALYQKGKALEVFHEFKALTKLATRLAGARLYEYSPNSVKKSFTGRGNADKDQMVEECLRRGYDIPYTVVSHGKNKGQKRYNDNCADAVAIYYTYLDERVANASI